MVKLKVALLVACTSALRPQRPQTLEVVAKQCLNTACACMAAANIIALPSAALATPASDGRALVVETIDLLDKFYYDGAARRRPEWLAAREKFGAAAEKNPGGAVRFRGEALKALGSEVSPGDAEKVFHQADMYDNNKLSLKEFIVCLLLGYVLGYLTLGDGGNNEASKEEGGDDDQRAGDGVLNAPNRQILVFTRITPPFTGFTRTSATPKHRMAFGQPMECRGQPRAIPSVRGGAERELSGGAAKRRPTVNHPNRRR